MSNHELIQIFYDGLGPQDRYLLDAASGGTFMSKFEVDAMELIETMAENSHHNAAKTILKRCNAGGRINQRKISRDENAPKEDR